MASISVLPDQENISVTSVSTKQIGVTRLQSTTKKNALGDVKNTLHQRNTAKESASKHQIVKRPTKHESYDASVKTVSASKITNSHKSVFDDDISTDVCCCPELPDMQDDYADILFKNTRLSKNQIDILAMEWEKTPVYNQADKRELDFPEAASFEIDYDLIAMNWPSEDQAIEEDFEVPPPEIDDILGCMVL